jgi:leucyl/phenylalanyl-tRNA--protein transferase
MSRPRFPPVAAWPADDLVCLGGDLEPETLLAAYELGLFPMPLDPPRGWPRRARVLGWWSPDPRGVLPLDGLRTTRSWRAAARRFTVTVDVAFPEVITRCADPRRPHGWIDDAVRGAYERLHALGVAHSVEAWTPDGRLAGGLYGVERGGLFAGESMWHEPAPWGRDASKVALLALVERLRAAPGGSRRLLDVQWATPHLCSLGVVEMPRAEYLVRLEEARGLPPAL